MLQTEQGLVSTPSPGCPGGGDIGVTPRVGKNRGAGEKRLKERERKERKTRLSALSSPNLPAWLQELPWPSSILMYSLKQINSSIIILSTLCNFYIISFHFPLPMHQKTYNGLVKFI